MLEFRELGKKYGATKFQGDEYPGQTFEDIYEDVFAPFKNEHLKILEIGVQEGSSLRVWRDYFPHSQIVGIDIDVASLYSEERIMTHLIDQSDESALEWLLKEYEYFDIVIDDGGHYSKQQIISLNRLLPQTKRIYCIEDLDTSYSEIFPEYSPKGEETIVMNLKGIIDQVVLDKLDIEKIDFRKRFCAIYKKGEGKYE